MPWFPEVHKITDFWSSQVSSWSPWTVLVSAAVLMLIVLLMPIRASSSFSFTAPNSSRTNQLWNFWNPFGSSNRILGNMGTPTVLPSSAGIFAGNASSASSAFTFGGTITSLFLLLVVLGSGWYLYHHSSDVWSEMEKIFPTKTVTATTTTTTTTTTKPRVQKDPNFKQVFNISDNVFTYDQAKAVCKAYDADLATYEQVEQSYNKGGEWCNYGWSQGQMALFPTQMDTYRYLQGIPKYKNSCGRPGVNGGFIDDPKMKFGVNCYGVKPAKTDANAANLPLPSENDQASEEEKKMQEQVAKIQKELGGLRIASFNYDRWNKPMN